MGQIWPSIQFLLVPVKVGCNILVSGISSSGWNRPWLLSVLPPFLCLEWADHTSWIRWTCPMIYYSQNTSIILHPFLWSLRKPFAEGLYGIRGWNSIPALWLPHFFQASALPRGDSLHRVSLRSGLVPVSLASGGFFSSIGGGRSLRVAHMW